MINIDPIVEFVDQFITTDGSNPEVQQFIDYQRHRHGRACLRDIRGQQVCRFNMPYPPMPRTEVLLPLDENEVSEQHLALLQKLKMF